MRKENQNVQGQERKKEHQCQEGGKIVYHSTRQKSENAKKEQKCEEGTKKAQTFNIFCKAKGSLAGDEADPATAPAPDPAAGGGGDDGMEGGEGSG